MPNPIPTAIGRVQPIFKGNFDDNETYNKLDNVYYQGNTWVCLKNGVTTSPANDGNWQLVASKGDTGGIGTPTATAIPLETGTAYATVTVDDTIPSSKVFSFEFGLPRGLTGPAGINSITADARSLTAGSDPTATVSLDTETHAATFTFGIPAAEGTGIKKIDDIGANVNGSAYLYAVVYGAAQSLSPAQQSQARSNINAQITGNYPDIVGAPSSNSVIYYTGSQWATRSINEVPAGTSNDVGKFLYFGTNNNMYWASVQALPGGGSVGMPLIKSYDNDYAVTWGSVISFAEIDSLFA